MLIRLRNTGFIESENQPIDNIGDIPNRLTKRARLVYVGEFESMDGLVKVTDEHLKKIAEGYNGKLSKLKRMASGKVAVASMPPVQLDHTRSARDTVGRLENSDLSIEDWTDEEGVTRKALYGNVHFLGRENVERVLDGRWSTLSIGADFNEGRIDELSVTPFPAADSAHLLRRGETRLTKEVVFQDESGGKYKLEAILDTANGKYEAKIDGQSLGWFLSEDSAIQAAQAEARKRTENVKLSNNEERMKLSASEKNRIRKFFKLKKKMSDEETEEKMKKLEAEDGDEEELKKLAEEMDDEEKKEKEEKSKKMSTARESVTRLAADFRAKKDSASLAAKAAQIGSRLSAIRASGRITPAESKKINLMELAGKGQEAIDTVLKSYEDRQPVILVGQLGSMKPMSLTDIETAGKKASISRLEMETRKNMSLLKGTVKQLTEGGQEGSADEVNIHIDTDPHTDMAGMDTDYTDLCKMIDEGRGGEAKERLKGFMDRMKKMGAYGMAEPTMHEQSMERLAALQSEITEMSAKFDEAIGLAESLASGEE